MLLLYLFMRFEMDLLYRFLLSVLVALSMIQIGCGLECYVCTKQENNIEKCLNTIKTCEQGEDMCLSEIWWGSTPYWNQGAEKQYYISKRCATKTLCEKTRNKYMSHCTHIWYQDWKCSECCQGDRCNFFVILSGSLARSSIVVLSMGVVAVFVVGRLFQN